MTSQPDDRYVIFFDIDNTLYSANSKISQAMGQRIHDYYVSLGFPEEEASTLHLQYYTKYGLAVRGLVRHHEVDPLDFNEKCDGSLPLEDMIKPDPQVRKLLQDIDRSKFRVWGLTNAYKTHAYRVLRILGIEDQFEGVYYCDYALPNFSCKPEAEFYNEAMTAAGGIDPSKCFFIDDSRANVDAACRIGFSRCVHFCERGLETMEGGKIKQIDGERLDGIKDSETQALRIIGDLEELRTLWPDVFKND